MMRFPRIRPYKTYSVDDLGARARIITHELVLERPVGVDLEVNLAPHPTFRGGVMFSTFRGSALLLEAGAANVLYVFVEDWPRGDRRRKSDRRRSRTPLGHVYSVDARGQKTALPERRFAIEVGERSELHIDFTPAPPWAHHVCVHTPDRALAIELNAANVVDVSVAEARRRRTAARVL